MKKLLTTIAIITSLSAFGQTAQDFYNKGVKKSNSQDFAGSIKDYNKAIKLDSKYTDAYYNRGTSRMYMKDYKGALADFDKAIELRPDFLNAYKNRGVVKLKLNDMKGAIKDLDVVLKIDPNNVSSYFMRGQIKLQSGDTEGGCGDLSKANELGDTRAQKFLQQYCGNIKSSNTEDRPNESLMIDWPDAEGWKVASNQEDKERKVIELLRNKETFDNWTEIGTMMVYTSLRNVPVNAAMNAMYEQAKKNCTSAKLTFIEKDDKAKYPWIIFKIECGSKTPESQVWHIMQGTNEMYVNFRAVKQKTVPGDLKDKWTKFFKTAKIVTQ